MGETQNQPFQLSFNYSLKVDFQGSRVTSDGGLILVRELDERLGLEKLIGETLERLATRLEQAVHAGRSTVTVGLQPLGWLRRPQRRRTTRSRSDVPIDQFAEDLGPGRGTDLNLALVRDRAADQGRESDRADGVEPGNAWAGRLSR